MIAIANLSYPYSPFSTLCIYTTRSAVIAVADRSHQQFYTSQQLITFAQKFRLPHNDYWVFSTKNTASKLFQFYDDIREVGTAGIVIKGLDQLVVDWGQGKRTVSMRIASMYPHEEYQGDILEGLVVRYVPFDGDSSSNEAFFGSLNELAVESKQYLSLLSEASERSQSINGPKQLEDFYSYEGDNKDAPDSLRRYLDGFSQCQRLEYTNGIEEAGDWNVSSWIPGVVESDTSVDNETSQIIRLIQRLKDLNVRVHYNLHKGDHCVCIIHVLHDASFKKYNFSRKEADMLLFRGFSIELIFDDGVEDAPSSSSAASAEAEHAVVSNTNTDDSAQLMLKMKFLPYMVRTFGCRNGLKVLSESGVYAYERYTLGMLNRWGISHGSIKKWQPYFYYWGQYAKSILECQTLNNNRNTSSLRPLSSQNYLSHVAAFENLYQSNQLMGIDIENASSGTKSKFRGIVLVVSLTKDKSTAFADMLATRLTTRKMLDDIRKLSEVDVLSSLLEDDQGGIICSAEVEDGISSIRKLNKRGQFTDALCIVLLGCDQAAIDSRYDAGSKELKKCSGMSKAWLKLPCKKLFEVVSNEESSAAVEEKEMDKIVPIISELSASLPSQDKGPGLLVFFPAIPGCGKSTLCSESVNKAIVKAMADASNGSFVTTCEGDRVNGKYWPHVMKQRLEKTSSVLLADKNAAPASWSSIADICDKSHALPVPVLPDSVALSTVVVEHTSPSASRLSRQCSYPFSLQYLAVCILRVLMRPTGSHNGKLDRSTEDACMVVVKFYCLYRDVSAETMLSTIHDKMLGSCLTTKNPVVTIPFFRKNCGKDELPQDLCECLTDALHLQVRVWYWFRCRWSLLSFLVKCVSSSYLCFSIA